MKRIFSTTVLCFTTITASTSAELKDPRVRDLDISRTEIAVSVERLDSGFFEYVYSLTAPVDNKGTVNALIIDIDCENPVDTPPFPEAPTTAPWDYFSKDGKHAPVQIYPSPTGSSWMIITRDNEVDFLVFSEPGESHTGFRILSPFPPADRSYELRVNWTTGDYDYSNLTDEEWDQLTVRDDFWVSGMTKGPGCSPQPEPPALFPGTGGEDDDDLLQYALPMRSAFHSEDGTVVFDIHYSADIDPETFKVQPGWAKKHFTPVPGTHQVVELKLHPGMNRFQFRVEGNAGEGTTDRSKTGMKTMDGDYFTIRRDPPGRLHERNKESGK